MFFGLGCLLTVSSRRQRSLVGIFENNGGDVRFEHHDGWSDSPRGPEWLRNIIGDGLFDKPTCVFFLANFDDTIPEEVLLAMSQLDSLEWISFRRTPGIVESQLSYVLPLTRLERLEVPLLIADDDIVRLGVLSHLTSLELAGPQITARGVAALKVFKKLDCLYVGTSLDDRAVAALSSLSTLKTLRFNAEHTSDQGFLNLCKLTHLTELTLLDPAVSMKAVERLKAAIPGIVINCIPELVKGP
jgi:hypothetical protein